MIRSDNPYFILTTLIFIFFRIYFLNTQGFIHDLSMNIGAGFVGAMVTIFFIDRSAEKKAEIERQNYIEIAFASLKREIENHYRMFLYMKLAASETPTHGNTTDFSSIFDDDFYEAVKHLNIYARAPVSPVQPWYLYIEQNFSSINKSCERIIDSYSIHLGANVTNKIEVFRGSEFNLLASSISIYAVLGAEMNMVFDSPISFDSTVEEFKDHISNLKQLIDIYQQYSPDRPITINKGSWSNIPANLISSARIINK